MKQAVDFLTGLAQAVSAMSLYKDGHPARERAIAAAHERLVRLQEEDPRPAFTFLGDELVLNGRPLRDLRNWDWANRLSRSGIQRLEFTGAVEQEDLEVFLEDALKRVSGEPIDPSEVRHSRPTNIRYGAVGLRGADTLEAETSDIVTATMGYNLLEEKQTVDWIHEELRDRRQLHLLEAEMLVRSLSVAMHGDQEFLLPLLKLKRYDQYTTTHAMNVAVLSMALAEYIGLGPEDVRGFGISGLLHDLGKVTIPEEILNKPGKLTDQERAVMNNHTVAGARMILETEEHLDLAAVVAYEHHIKLNGGGYPTLSFPRACHQASNLVHVCDVFDALRTDRPYREAWPTDKAVAIIEEGAGTEFDPDLAHAFLRMIAEWEGRLHWVEEPDEELPLGDGADAGGPDGA